MIKFFTQNYVIEDASGCPVPETEYTLPIKAGDTVNFIVSKDSVLYRGDDLSQIEIGLSSCGILEYYNIGTIINGTFELYCSVTIPNDISGCNYEIMFYSTVENINCGDYMGFTLQEVIDEGITLGDVIQCTLNDFLP